MIFHNKKRWCLFSLYFFSMVLVAQIRMPTSVPEWTVDAYKNEANLAKITVDEGTWMNVSISPDSQTIVFDLLGDIYSIQATGGKAKALTSDIAWQMQPSFSPDGKQIAFTSDEGGGENIWIMNVDGEQKRAISNETFRMVNSPAWSSDGKHIAVRKHFTGTRSLGAGEIWLYPTGGGEGFQLVERPNQQKDMGEPAFSPDGLYVYFSQDVTPGAIFEYSKDSEKGIYAIKRIIIETGEIEVVLSGRGGAIRPTVSPDGTKLAYISRINFQSTLILYDLKTAKKTILFDRLDRDKQASWAMHGVYPAMSWTSDSQQLLFWADGKINKLNIDSQIVEQIPFEVTREKSISKTLRFSKNIDKENFEVKMLRNVTVSPDGKELAFEALGYIYTRDLPKGRPKRLTKQTDHFEFDPSFSRDGKKIVYSTWHDKKQGNIRVSSARGGEGKKLLTNPGKYIEAEFSPNGETIVFRKFKDERVLDPSYNVGAGIYQVSASGGVARLITKNGRAPHFSNRNDRVYIQRDGEMPTLAEIDLDGQNDKTIYIIKYATEFKMSPEGNQLGFVEHYRVRTIAHEKREQPLEIIDAATEVSVQTISERAGANINFSNNSQHIYWNLGPDLYSASLVSETTSVKENYISFLQTTEKPNGSIALVGGQVITMEGDEVIENGVVLVDGNHISAVGKNGEVEIPNGTKIIDVKGKAIIPGIIDTHAHQPQGSNGIIPQQNWSAYATLAFGVTSIFNPNTNTSEIFGASEMQKAGNMLSPRIFSTGMSLYGAYEPGHTAIVNSLADARFHMDRLKRVGAFAIKMHHHPRREQYQQMIKAPKENEIMVLSEGGALLQQDLGKIADGASSIEHSVALANLYDDVYQFWSQSETALVPTLVVSFGGISGEHYWYAKSDVWKHPRLSKFVPQDILAPRAMRRMMAPDHHYNHFNVVKTVKKMNDLGITIGIGGHGQREGLAAHWEMWMMVQGGMTPMQALQAATIKPATHLGLNANIGSLKAGKLADITVFDGDVLQDIRESDKVKYVMLNGRLFDAVTMNEIGNYDIKRQPFYFEKSQMD